MIPVIHGATQPLPPLRDAFFFSLLGLTLEGLQGARNLSRSPSASVWVEIILRKRRFSFSGKFKAMMKWSRSVLQGLPPALFSSSFWLTELDNDRDPALTIAGNGSF
ncbi:hypothetical protein NC651_028509 [Populus alba x Populus x berolinensis]|nr:hypothetical protein NC651_028509 [Populus alba x Populus x berolinensis]